MSHPLLTAPIGRSLWRLAGPTTALIVVQILAGLAEIWIVGRLGTESLAGYVLVIPFAGLMGNMANGGMGGSVASALARALGGGRLDDARAILLHAALVALGLALLFGVLAWTVLPHVFVLMGGSGRTLHEATVYSSWWFAGAVLTWLAAFMSALFRGCGDAFTPSRLGLILAPIYTVVSLLMTLGIGEWPGVGIAGPAIAAIVTTAGVVIVLVRAIQRGGLGFAPSLEGVRLQRRLFSEIMHIGVMGSVSTVSASATALLVTALVGGFGPAALAGYGIGVRTEAILSPLTFGVGTGLTTIVGVAAGAGDWKRAYHYGDAAAEVEFGLTGAIGWAIALMPESFSRLFSSDPEVIAVSVSYLTRVAPFECLFGLGLALHFASQGAGRMAAPLTASIVRMLVATAGGWFAIEHFGLGLNGVFWAMAASLVLYGGTIAGPLFARPWRAR